MGQLWCSLVYVACKQPGVQRLKAISLLLKIIVLQDRAGCGEVSKHDSSSHLICTFTCTAELSPFTCTAELSHMLEVFTDSVGL